MRSFSIFPVTINFDNYVREDAARAYYWPFSSRPNLSVLTNSFLNRIVWKTGATTDSTNLVIASSVEVTFANGTVGVVGATQEVVVSAGALKTPGILELSEIGNPTILSQNGIHALANLPTVGENLQDQITTTIGADGVETVADAVTNNISQYAQRVSAASGNTMKNMDLQTLFNVQYDLIFKQKIPRRLVFKTVATAFIAQAEYRSHKRLPVAEQETLPGYTAVPEGASDDVWKQWLVTHYRSNFHPIGTAAMMPRDIGGVVDVNHTVYGTAKVRLADASALLFQVCGHLVSTLYVEAERVADVIKSQSPLF
ncbi:glucose oxidase [Penicillium subrubescens]|uniref:glucose oxidase n=1 Tax=Penicillium subrubescens TaxID=1316194 RepID=UPI002544EA4A|nr:glucose oxidase [Penicillium subrubescens]KAJ5885960.1 glucose oxidase [Penicillium subrubescens]